METVGPLRIELRFIETWKIELPSATVRDLITKTVR